MSADLNPKLASIEKLAAAVIQERLGLQNILQKFGRQSAAEYAAGFGQSHKTVSPQLQDEFTDSIIRCSEPVFGKKESARIGQAVRQNYYALTGDHHGPLTHPFFLNSVLLAAAHLPADSSLLVLASSNVSLNNSSHPRGFLYHSGSGLTKFNLLPAKNLMTPVYSARGYRAADLQRLAKDIQRLPQAEKLQKLINLLSQEQIISQPRFGDQITLINQELGRQFFPDSRLPNLVYLELEKIAVDLLLHHHVDHSTVIHEIIFNPAARQIFIENFKNIPGSFGDNQGTVLFWHLPKNSGKRIGLVVAADDFISADQSSRIAIEPGNIRHLLENGELIPSTVFALLLVSAYYGVKCLGGFSQTTYLTQAQGLYNRLFLSAPPDPLEHTQTLGADLVVAYRLTDDKLVPATGLDLILDGTDQSWHNFKQTSESINLTEAFYPLLPELHRELFSGSTEFAELGLEEILHALDLKSRIRPVATL